MRPQVRRWRVLGWPHATALHAVGITFVSFLMTGALPPTRVLTPACRLLCLACHLQAVLTTTTCTQR